MEFSTSRSSYVHHYCYQIPLTVRSPDDTESNVILYALTRKCKIQGDTEVLDPSSNNRGSAVSQAGPLGLWKLKESAGSGTEPKSVPEIGCFVHTLCRAAADLWVSLD